MKNFKQRKKSGFTLVEMVVVVSILGILAGLGFMKFDQVQETARLNADHIAANNLATAATLYLNDNPNFSDEAINVDDLKDKYISIVPKPQSVSGDFYIAVSEKKVVAVKVGENSFYPK